MRRIVGVAAAVAMAACATSQGFLVEFGGTPVNLEYWSGAAQGQNEAVMVADFGGGNSYAFGFRWDGQATGYDMLQAVDAAGDFAFTYTDYGAYGVGIESLSFGGHSMQGYAGYPTDWMGYWLSSNGNDWTLSTVGVSSRELANGNWDGWGHETTVGVGDFGYDAQTQPQTPVPEPTTWALCAVGGAVMAWRRRRGVRAGVQ